MNQKSLAEVKNRHLPLSRREWVRLSQWMRLTLTVGKVITNLRISISWQARTYHSDSRPLRKFYWTKRLSRSNIAGSKNRPLTESINNSNCHSWVTVEIWGVNTRPSSSRVVWRLQVHRWLRIRSRGCRVDGCDRIAVWRILTVSVSVLVSN